MFSFLQHHKDRVEQFFPGITDPEQARKVVKESWIPGLKNMRWRFLGSKIYPNMDEGRLAESLARLIVAVNTGDVDPIPEIRGDGSRNHDEVCEACGNLDRSATDGFTCGAERVAASIQQSFSCNIQEEMRRFREQHQCDFAKQFSHQECERLNYSPEKHIPRQSCSEKFNRRNECDSSRIESRDSFRHKEW